MNKKILLGVVAVVAIVLIVHFTSSPKAPVSLVQDQTIPTEMHTYEWCIENGGNDDSPLDFNGPKSCVLDNKVYAKNCMSNDQYIVISKNLNDSAGSDILIKDKSNKGENFSCDYIAGKNDFEIKNGEADYLYALTNNFLLIDSGTGPSGRQMIVYDLKNRKKIYSDWYDWPFKVRGNLIIYSGSTSEKPTIENCPKLNEFLGYGGGAVIERFITVDLTTLKKTESGEKRCSYVS